MYPHNMKTLWRRVLVLGPRAYGQTQAQPASADSLQMSATPYFTENPGDPIKAGDASATFDYMPSQYITFRWEFDHRAANVPYFSGPGGITPPGGNTGALGSLVQGFRAGSRQNREQARFLTAG
jgi:hypothetical protein